jgi:hypothetical protein
MYSRGGDNSIRRSFFPAGSPPTDYATSLQEQGFRRGLRRQRGGLIVGQLNHRHGLNFSLPPDKVMGQVVMLPSPSLLRVTGLKLTAA